MASATCCCDHPRRARSRRSGFTSQTCVPRIGFPCSHSGVWKVTFIGADQGSPRVWVDRTFPPDAGVTLYTTP
jgi:hypothetical protein